VVDAESVKLGPVLPPQVQQVLEPFGGDERGCRPLALEQRVRGHRRSVGEALDPICCDPACGRDDRLLLPLCSRNLGCSEVVFVREQDCVGKRAADVDAEDGHVTKLQL
jgi:hypothetical protein